jgi:ribosomal protein S18 acetylase RimI-like enzyme
VRAPLLSPPATRPGVQLCTCTAADIGELQMLSTSVLPVRYPKSFYESILADTRLCRYARCDGKLVGAIVMTWVRNQQHQQENQMGVALICVLAPYRRQGIGTLLLADMAHRIRTEPDLAAKIDEIYLHVHVANAEARAFYRSMGFEAVERLNGYYPHLKPTAALKLRSSIRLRSYVAIDAAAAHVK